MAINQQAEFQKIAKELTKLTQDELRRKGLVDTGALLNSVKWIVVSTPQGFSIKMEALDYFTYLDDKYNITKDLFNTAAYERIQVQIGELYNYIILEQLTDL